MLGASANNSGGVITRAKKCLCGFRQPAMVTCLGSPLWFSFSSSFAQGTPHALGIEVFGIDGGARLLSPGFLDHSGINAVESQFVH
jgi:hypothetical protein